MSETTQDKTLIQVWDPFVRIGHWVLVAGFAIAWLTGEELDTVHEWSGYAVALVVALRVVWGFIGPEHARFSDFVTAPGKALAYLMALVQGRAERHVGHSPAGGAMTVALLVCLGLTCFTGMATLAADENEGPLAPWFGTAAAVEMPALISAAKADGGEEREHEGGEGESVWGEAHELFANLTLALVILHVLGVGLASVMHRENLAKGMVTGMKRP